MFTCRPSASSASCSRWRGQSLQPPVLGGFAIVPTTSLAVYVFASDKTSGNI